MSVWNNARSSVVAVAGLAIEGVSYLNVASIESFATSSLIARAASLGLDWLFSI